MPRQVAQALIMGMPAWARPSPTVVIVLPRITEEQLRQAQDLLAIWAYENRPRDAEVSNPDYGQGEIIGQLIECGPEAMRSRGKEPGLGPLAMECDRLIGKLSKRQQRVLRLSYVSYYSPQDAAIRLKVSTDEYWTEVKAAVYAVAAQIKNNSCMDSPDVVGCA